MPRLREKKRFREQRILGIRTGIPTYIPPELVLRGFKLKFYDLSDVKIGEIGSDVKAGGISTVNFELMGLGCAAFSFVIDEMPKIFKYEIDLEDDYLAGYWPLDKGSGMVAYDKSKNGNDGTLYPTPVLINVCDALTDWSSSLGSLSIDTADKKEGTGSLKDTIASPLVDTWYSTQYNPAGSWDWSGKKHILHWLKSDRASTAFAYARLQINDTSDNWRYWNLTFSAGEWTVVKKLLSTGDGESGTPPDLALINRVFISFKAADTTPFYKKIDDLRIGDRPQWVDGKVNKALDFDGEDDWVNCGENVRPVSAISVSVWLKPHAFQASGVAVSSGRSGGTLLFYPSGTTVRFYVYTTGWNYITMPQADISLDEWHHFVLTYDQTNLKIFMDGEEKNSGGLSGDITYDGKNFEIGRYSGTGPYFDGLIDEVLVYNKALAPTEVKALYELKVGKYIDAFDMAYRTRVDIHPYFDDTPWFTGFIQSIPQIGQKRPFEYSGFGFFEQLDWVTVTGSYASQDVAVIVKDIIQNVVAPNTQIIYNAAKIQSPGYTVESIDFDHTYAKDAIQTLADMAQDFEFGVDNSREFYFRPIDTVVHYSYWVGKHFQNIEIEQFPHTVRNKLYIKIGEIQAGGTNIIGSVHNNDSINAHGLREEVINVPESLDTTDATRWANEILAKMKDPSVKAEIKNIFFDETKAKIDAKGKARITVYDGTEYELFVRVISYTISAAGILGEMELGS